MPLKIYDTKEAAPEAQRANAVELKDGKWAVEEPAAPAEGMTEADRTALKNALAKERTDRETAQAELARLKREAEARGKGIPEEELERIRKAEEESRKPILTENETLKAENQSLKGENRRLKLTDKVQALALKHGVLPERLEDAMMHLEKRTDLADQGGIVVKDKEGKTTAETIDKFLSDTFKKEKPWLYAGTGGSGSGAGGSHGRGSDDDGQPKNEGQGTAELRDMVAGAF